MEQGFWKKLKKPIVGLAPMDGVTDAPFRYITAKYGKSDLFITEFTSVEGIAAGAIKTLRAFIYDKSEKPVLAQLFGSSPEAFYKAAFVVCELGFDGIDINMGCPASNIASKGAGASLIRTPELAKEIVRKTIQASKDWAEGRKVEDVGLPDTILHHFKGYRPSIVRRKTLPVSVKTRIGYDKAIVEEWISHLLEVKPAAISIHGRTLKQMYSGNANWEEIAKAAELIHREESKTVVLGNGDIKNLAEGAARIKAHGVDGVLIGRAAFGNPWVFSNEASPAESTQSTEAIEPATGIQLHEKFKVALEHAKYYEKLFGNEHFVVMRKHLAWYCRGFANASEIRKKLMFTCSAKEVEEILKEV